MSTFLYIKRVNKNFVFWKKKKFRAGAYPSLIIINIINMMFNKYVDHCNDIYKLTLVLHNLS